MFNSPKFLKPFYHSASGIEFQWFWVKIYIFFARYINTAFPTIFLYRRLKHYSSIIFDLVLVWNKGCNEFLVWGDAFVWASLDTWGNTGEAGELHDIFIITSRLPFFVTIIVLLPIYFATLIYGDKSLFHHVVLPSIFLSW